MTIQTAAAKQAEAHNNLTAARTARNEMAEIVSREQTGFERMVPLTVAVASAERAADWADTLLVSAIKAGR